MSVAASAPVAFDDLAGWGRAPFAASLQAFRRHCPKLAERVPDYAAVCNAQAALPSDVDDDVARTFFEIWFRVEAVGSPGEGFVTGYFEPELQAARAPSPEFSVPVYRRPDDLVAVDPAARPDGLPDDLTFARRTEDGLVPFPDRPAIQAGALAGKGLELAWLADPVDAYFMHIQGSGRLRFRDGSTLRVSYAGKSGHPYTSIGRIVIDRGHIPADQLDYQSLRDWLKANPDEAREIMAENRSYIFFAPVDGLSEEDGPLGAAGVPLVPEVSLAVDLDYHSFGMPIWLDAELPLGEGGKMERFQHLMIAEDRGSAIVGRARGDIFLGFGAAAGDRAGRLKHAATVYRLVPKGTDTDEQTDGD